MGCTVNCLLSDYFKIEDVDEEKVSKNANKTTTAKDDDDDDDEKEMKPTIHCSSSIQILHFNDVYDINPKIKKDGSSIGGASRFKTIIKRICSALPEDKQPIICFSGDFLSPSAIGSITDGTHMIPVMNNLGITCMCLGNHDLDYGNEQCIDVVKQLHFPVLNTNILTPKRRNYDINNDDDLVPCGNALKSYVYKHNDLTVGFVGMSHDWTPSVGIKPENGFVYRPYIEECQKHIDILNKENKIDLMIVLSHMTDEADKLLAHKVNGIDLILGGHIHEKLFHVDKDNKTIVIKSGYDFENISWIQLQVVTNRNMDPSTCAETQKIAQDLEKSLDESTQPYLTFVGSRYQAIIRHYNIDEKLPFDVETDKIIAKATQEYNELTQKVIGRIEVDLDATVRTLRTKESNAGNFITEVVRRLYNVDAAVLNSGCIRADRIIPAGDITFAHILALVPFNHPMVVVRLKGSTIVKMLEHSVKRLPNLSSEFLQMTGLKMLFDIKQPEWKRVKTAWINVDRQDEEKWDSIENDKVYSIAMNAHMAHGNGAREFIPDEMVGYVIDEEEGVPCYTVLQNFFNGVKTINGILEALALQDITEEKEEEDDGDISTDDDWDDQDGINLPRATLLSPQLSRQQKRRLRRVSSMWGNLSPRKSTVALLSLSDEGTAQHRRMLIAPMLRQSMLRVSQSLN